MRGWMACAAVGVAGMALAACGADPSIAGCATAAEQDATMALGTGEGAFVAVADDDTVPFVMGPQGGYHVFGSFQATGIWPGTSSTLADDTTPLLSFTATADTFTGGFTDVPRPLTEVATDTWGLIGELVILTITDPSEADGKTATLSVSLTDACGTTVTDSHDVTLQFFQAL
ncbi:MAG: hypothetical protein H6733_07105 [Alphaproteobacteria bacterium]|nr:hypothetical protein [Alphaproteobacteria bacterium]